MRISTHASAASPPRKLTIAQLRDVNGDFRVEVAAAGMVGWDARDVAWPETLAVVQAMLQSHDNRSTLQKNLLARAATLAFGEFVADVCVDRNGEERPGGTAKA